MRKKILEILGGHFDVDGSALKKYFNIAEVRLDKQELQQIPLILQNKGHLLEQVLLGKESSKWLNELQLIDKQNSQHFLEVTPMPDAYRDYLEKLSEEINNPKLSSPSLALREAEHNMLEDFADRKFIEDDYSALEGLETSVLRTIMQKWLLHPELIINRDDVELMFYMLEMTGLEI